MEDQQRAELPAAEEERGPHRPEEAVGGRNIQGPNEVVGGRQGPVPLRPPQPDDGRRGLQPIQPPTLGPPGQIPQMGLGDRGHGDAGPRPYVGEYPAGEDMGERERMEWLRQDINQRVRRRTQDQERQRWDERIDEIQRRMDEQERRNVVDRQLEELNRRMMYSSRHPVMKPSKFHLGKDNFKSFLSSFKIFARAANIPPEREIENLMCCLDEKAQRRVETLRLTEEDYRNPNQCYEKLADVLNGIELRAQAKMRIFDIRQGRNETITDFAARLMDEADLAYGTEEDGLKDRLLLEIFMRGLYDDNIAHDLLKEHHDDFDTAYQQALGLEGIYSVRKTNTSAWKERRERTAGNEYRDDVFSVQADERRKFPDRSQDGVGQSGTHLRRDDERYQDAPQEEVPRLRSPPPAPRAWNGENTQDWRDQQREPSDGRNRRPEPCERCGRYNHRTGDCQACFHCGRMGHWVRECPQRRGNNTTRQNGNYGSNGRGFHGDRGGYGREYTPNQISSRGGYGREYTPNQNSNRGGYGRGYTPNRDLRRTENGNWNSRSNGRSYNDSRSGNSNEDWGRSFQRSGNNVGRNQPNYQRYQGNHIPWSGNRWNAQEPERRAVIQERRNYPQPVSETRSIEFDGFNGRDRPVGNYEEYERQVRFQDSRRQGRLEEDARAQGTPRSADVNLCGGNIYVRAIVGGQPVLSLVDTGCSTNLISKKVFDLLKNCGQVTEHKPEYRTSLKSASGDYLNTYGKVEKMNMVVDEGLETEVDLVVAAISEDLILGSEFLLNSAATIDYGSLTMKCGDQTIPLIQPSNRRTTAVVRSVMEKRLYGNSVVTCVIEGENLQLPGSFIYQPVEGKYMCESPSVVNVCNNVIEVRIDTDSPYMMKKNEIVGTISEVDKVEMREEAATWKWTQEERSEEIWKQLKLEDNNLLTTDQKKEAKGLITRYHDVFSISKKEIGLTNMYVHKIKLKKEGTIINKNRPIPMHKFGEAQKTMKDLIDMGVLEPSTSKNRSNLVLVNKKDGTKRFTADLRKLNDMIEDCEHPMPTIWETRNIWAGCKLFSVLDLSSAYYQIPLEESSRDYTTIWVNGIGSYRFTRAPMGMKSSGSALQSLTDRLFQDVKKEVCCNFLDDIISGNKTVEGMLKNLEIIFERLRMGGLKVRSDKTELFKDHVKYLGCKLTEEGLNANMDKVGDLMKIDRPKTKKEVQKFLGLAGYFREFIPNFADKSEGLRKLLIKERNFDFDEEALASFDNLKQSLVSPPVLAWPDEEKEFHLFTDASDIATGFCLAQYDSEGRLHPVCYGSRSFNKSQQHWASFVKEYFAVYCAVERLRYYLFGKKFTLHTDCQALMFEKTLRKCTSNAVLRWSIELSQFSFDIEYIAGKDNIISDSLSRLPQKSSELFDFIKSSVNKPPEVVMGIEEKADESEEQPEKDGKMMTKKEIGIEKSKTETIPVEPAIHIGNEEYLKMLREDKLLNKVKKWVTGEEKIEDPAMLSHQERQYANKLDLLYINDQDLLCRKYFSKKLKLARYLICVPTSAVRKVIEFYHEKAGCHLAADKTRDRIIQKFYFPNFFEEIQLFCRTCSPCFKVNLKYHQKESQKLKPYIYKYPNLCVAMDVVKIKKGSKEEKVLTLVDRFTKWANFTIIKNEKSETIARAIMHNWICLWGPMDILVSDNAKSFKESEIMQHVYELMGIEKKYCSPYHPEGNGSAERFNKVLVDLLSKLVDERPNTWKTKLPLLSMAVNSAINRSTGYSAYKLMTGREMPGLDNIVFDSRTTQYYQSEDHLVDTTYLELRKIFEIASDHLELNHCLQKRTYDRNKTCVKLEEGDRVLLYRPTNVQNVYQKLTSCWTGPYVITKNINSHNFHLEREEDGVVRIAHRNHLRKIPSDIRGKLAKGGEVESTDQESQEEKESSSEEESGWESESDDYVERFEDDNQGHFLELKTHSENGKGMGAQKSPENTQEMSGRSVQDSAYEQELDDGEPEHMSLPRFSIPPMVITSTPAISDRVTAEESRSSLDLTPASSNGDDHEMTKHETMGTRNDQPEIQEDPEITEKRDKVIQTPGITMERPMTSQGENQGRQFKRPRYTEYHPGLTEIPQVANTSKGKGKAGKTPLSTPVRKLLSRIIPRRSARNVGKPKVDYYKERVEDWEF